MEFASKFALVDQKSVLADEEAEAAPIDGPVDVRTDDSTSSMSRKRVEFRAPPGRPLRVPAPPVAPSTNVCRVDVGSINLTTSIATGDPTVCSDCNSVLSSISKVEAAADGSYTWVCEFCGAENTELHLSPDELPSSLPTGEQAAKGVDYLLAPPPMAADAAAGGAASGQIVFVLDTSGSMCLSEPISDALARKIRGASNIRDEFERLRAAGDADNQFLPAERRGVQYVSRMQALQAAVASQIEQLAKAKPEQKIGFVTFATDVTVIGDGSADSRTLSGKRLDDFEILKATGEGYRLTNAVKESKEGLIKRVYELSEEGQTALGPALVVAVAIAAQQAGSKVVVVTDGMSNVGCGSLEPPEPKKGATPAEKTALPQQHKDTAAAFFNRVSSYASAAGVSIDVIGFEGANCNLEALGALAEATNGNTTRVNIANITEQFSNILEDEVVATNCAVTMTAHCGVFIRDPAQDIDMEVDASAPPAVQQANTVSMLRDKYAFRAGKVKARVAAAAPAIDSIPEDTPVEDIPAVKLGASSLSMYIGNVTTSTEVTFEYGQKRGKDLSKELRAQLAVLKTLPFQVQVAYTRKDGAQLMRVMTSSLEITSEEARAAEHFSATPMVSHASRSVAAMAKKGRYEAASKVTTMYQGYMASNVRRDDADGLTSFTAWNHGAEELQTALKHELESEAPRGKLKKTRAAPARNAASAPSAPAAGPAATGGGGFLAGLRTSVSSLFSTRTSDVAPAAPPMSSSSSSHPVMAPTSEALPTEERSREYEADDDLAFGGAGGEDELSSEGEEVDAAAMHSRVERRTNNDNLSAQIYVLAKGGKKFAKIPKSSS